MDQRTKDGVYGWRGTAGGYLNPDHVPLILSNIAVLFYYENEIFVIVNKDLTISEDGRICR